MTLACSMISNLGYNTLGFFLSQIKEQNKEAIMDMVCKCKM